MILRYTHADMCPGAQRYQARFLRRLAGRATFCRVAIFTTHGSAMLTLPPDTCANLRTLFARTGTHSRSVLSRTGQHQRMWQPPSKSTLSAAATATAASRINARTVVLEGRVMEVS